MGTRGSSNTAGDGSTGIVVYISSTDDAVADDVYAAARAKIAA